ncbi:GspE/PulE family protein [Noviherbaspirillum pedocola]|uniref:Flp pilus assembly complex ATPase component TadA n=1 Tax=Noviherbaspirillum pedocola TaxID=2801341 RepID=A0A934SXY8_9BURK|nr:ATPase, T2SS/T4P/T4SS family [Noviherbaspirillum pedocola]MBK4738901.1 Flp pilus assembly complex ATPase component TadA [Noviherbaspirillum pedocola]
MNHSEQLMLARRGIGEASVRGQALIDAGLISPSQLDICLRQQAYWSEQGRTLFIEEILVRNRFVSKNAIVKVNADTDGGATSSLFQKILPVQVCKQYQIYPLRVTNETLEMRSATPLTERQIASILQACEVKVSGVKIIPTDRFDVYETLNRLSSGEHSFPTMLARLKVEAINGVLLRQAYQSMLIEAIDMRASDIHLDRKPDPEAWISHRIDGTLEQTHLVPASLMSALFMRLKTEANMDASDDRRAQDGRLSIEVRGRLIDFRVATQPVVGGETMTLRVLDPDALITLDELFPNQPDMAQLFRNISRVEGKSGGLILFSGPTGSGKTTSLYALAQEFPRDEANILTVEQPVEYVLPFTRQIQLNAHLKEQALDVERSMLRQDPDVLILGEIRDSDTMMAALQFAQSGHLVLATIHANNPAETFERVTNFAEGSSKASALYMLANNLRVVVSQHLVKTLCTCASAVDAADDIADIASKAAYRQVHLRQTNLLRRAKGCPRCRHTGYYGRVASHETLIIATDSQTRADLTALVFDSGKAYSRLKEISGVTIKSREESLARLQETGVIDLATTLKGAAKELL